MKALVLETFSEVRFRFADSESMANAMEAIEQKKKSAFLVLGKPVTGKTKFITTCLTRHFREAKSSNWNQNSYPSMAEACLDGAKAGYLFLDNYPGSKLNLSLLHFVTHPFFSGRRRWARMGETEPNDAMVFISAPFDFPIPEDVARRFKVIRMADSLEEGGAV
jgi:hypothetical protein